MGKKSLNQDYIDAALAPKQKRDLYRLTVKIDRDLYERAAPVLEGKFSVLMEGAIREALERIKPGKAS